MDEKTEAAVLAAIAKALDIDIEPSTDIITVDTEEYRRNAA